MIAYRAVELIQREILRQNPEADSGRINAVLIDFLLYDLAKEKEAAGKELVHYACTQPSLSPVPRRLESFRVQFRPFRRARRS